jgi:hypothetical protein
MGKIICNGGNPPKRAPKRIPKGAPRVDLGASWGDLPGRLPGRSGALIANCFVLGVSFRRDTSPELLLMKQYPLNASADQ